MECRICYLRFTRHKRKKITCLDCNLQFCLQCFYRNAELSTSADIKCPQCARTFSKEFIRESTNRNFMNTVYREKYTEMLFANQMSFRGSTAQFIDSLKRKRSIQQDINRCNEIINEQKRAVTRLVHKINDENDFYYGKLEDAEKKNSVPERNCTEIGCNGILRFQENEERSDGALLEFAESTQSLESVESLELEECVSTLGILGDIVMVCTSCEKRVCGVCYKPYVTEQDCMHMCKQEDLDSLRMIEKDCKPCPSCRVPIMYESGCSQMFCTSCHCAFDWRSLRIFTSGSYFHNPHYASFRESNGGGSVNSSIPADHFFQSTRIAPEEISFLDIEKKVKEVFGACGRKELAEKSKTMKGYLYFANECLENYGKSKIEMEELRHRQSRVKYMMNELDEKDFKESLYLYERHNECRDMLEEELRNYAKIARNALLRWAKLGEISDVEAVESIQLSFTEAKRRVSEFYSRMKKSPVTVMKLFATNNYFLSSA